MKSYGMPYGVGKYSRLLSSYGSHSIQMAVCELLQNSQVLRVGARACLKQWMTSGLYKALKRRNIYTRNMAFHFKLLESMGSLSLRMRMRMRMIWEDLRYKGRN